MFITNICFKSFSKEQSVLLTLAAIETHVDDAVGIAIVGLTYTNADIWVNQTFALHQDKVVL